MSPIQSSSDVFSRQPRSTDGAVRSRHEKSGLIGLTLAIVFVTSSTFLPRRDANSSSTDPHRYVVPSTTTIGRNAAFRGCRSHRSQSPKRSLKTIRMREHFSMARSSGAKFGRFVPMKGESPTSVTAGVGDLPKEIRIACMGFTKVLREQFERIIREPLEQKHQMISDVTVLRTADDRHKADLALVDLHGGPLPETSRLADGPADIALISPSVDVAQHIYRAGFYDYVTFPFVRDELRVRVVAAFVMKLYLNERTEVTRNPILDRACRILRQHLDTKISLQELCKLCGCNHTTITEIFQKELGMSPMTWYRKERLREAAILLRSSDHTISDISFGLGFNDSNHFSVAFRRVFGLTPSQFRKAEKHKGDTENFEGP